jgi:hypothetical protein
MRGFAVLLSYVVGLSAVIGIGMMGLMALNRPTPSAANKPTPSAAPVVAASQKERVAKPIKQTTVAQKDAQPSQKRKVVYVARKRKEEAPTFSSGFSAYGYAQEPRRFYQYPSPFFSR